jgi:hypothetical protein
MYMNLTALLPRQAEQRTQADADQATWQGCEKPDPSMQRAGGYASDKSADIAPKAEAGAPPHEQSADSGRKQ